MTHGLQPAHVALTRHSCLRYRDGPVEEEEEGGGRRGGRREEGGGRREEGG